MQTCNVVYSQFVLHFCPCLFFLPSGAYHFERRIPCCSSAPMPPHCPPYYLSKRQPVPDHCTIKHISTGFGARLSSSIVWLSRKSLVGWLLNDTSQSPARSWVRPGEYP